MKARVVLKTLCIEGFGHFSGVEVQPSPGLHLFYGANEAGKSTLLGFVRGILFGLEKRGAPARYEPEQGAHGGEIVLETSRGDLHVIRHAKRRRVEGELTIRDANGERLPEDALSEALGGVSRQLFNEVFAFSLEELSSFERLAEESSVSEAFVAAGLHGALRLPGALDRLRRESERLFSPRAQQRELNLVFRSLAEVQERLDRAGDRPAAYFEARRKLEEIRAELLVAGAERRRLEAACHALRRRTEAYGLLEEWERLARELSARGELATFSPGALERLEGLQGREQRARDEARAVGAELDALAAARSRRVPTPDLRRALEAAERYASVRAQARALPARRTRLVSRERALANEFIELAVPGKPEALLTRGFSPHARGKVAVAGEALLDAQRRGRSADELALLLEHNEAREEERWQTVRDALGDEEDISVERVREATVALARIPETREALLQASAVLRDAQAARASLREMPSAHIPSFPIGSTRLLLALSVAGVPIAGLLASGWARALAMAATGVVATLLFLLMRSLRRASRDAEARVRAQIRAQEGEVGRLDALEMSLRDRERAARAMLDACTVRAGVGALATPDELLERAGQLQGQLAALEDLERCSAQLARCQDEASQGHVRRQDSHQLLQRERETWRDLLALERLPPSLGPAEALGIWDRLAELKQRLIELRAEAEALRLEEAEVEGAARALRDACEELGVRGEDAEATLARLRAAAESARELREEVRRQDEHELLLRAQATRWGTEQEEVAEGFAALFAGSNCADAEELRRKADESRAYRIKKSRSEELAARIETLADESLDSFRSHSAKRGSAETWTAALAEAETALEEASGRVEGCAETGGSLTKQLEGWAQDGELQALRAQEQELKARAAELADRFAVEQLALLLLERAKELHRLEHQPRLLQRASEHFWGLTRGRYGRVWAEAGGGLRVLDKSKREWDASTLSRGTREQLYLAFRVALVEDLSEHKPALPLVLDDVLVNFDLDRAEAAVDLFARLAERHQVLALTCHPWIRALFVAHGAQVTDLSAEGAALRGGPPQTAGARG